MKRQTDDEFFEELSNLYIDWMLEKTKSRKEEARSNASPAYRPADVNLYHLVKCSKHKEGA
jgi:hypothetical protein